MLTREECKALVSGPGKFENEPIYAPYYYDIMMQGGADITMFPGTDQFTVTKEDRLIFPELKGIKTIIQSEDDNGFVHTSSE